VQVHSSLKVTTQVTKVIKKHMVYLLSSAGALSTRVGKSCCSYIKPWLGSIWSIACSSGHHTTTRIWKLWRVQKMFTRMLPGLKCVDYEAKLNKLGLFSLEIWRLRGDPDRGLQNYERHRQSG